MWKHLTTLEQLNDILRNSENTSILFKHSTRCSISKVALERMERNYSKSSVDNATFYYLDLLQYRDISNAIAQKLQVEHQSPQVLVVKDGKVIYHASHFDIQFDEVMASIPL